MSASGDLHHSIVAGRVTRTCGTVRLENATSYIESIQWR